MALGLVGSFAATAAAQDSGALIDALVRKGVLKDQEAEQIRSQLSRDFAANTPAGKLNLSSSVKELKLSGDVRVRGQYDTQDSQTSTTPVNGDQRTRYRVRLRINADYKVNDDFFAGFGLQTEQKNDSGNQTMAGGFGSNGAQTVKNGSLNLPNGTSSAGDYHQNYPIYISKAFLGWNPIPGVTVIGGKQVNPFYTTDLVWDADINPTGFTERVDLHKFLELGPLELSLVGGQFVLSDNNENNATGKTNRDAFAYQTQLIAAMNVAEGVKVTVAPGFYCTNAANVAGDAGGELNSQAWAFTGANQTNGLKVLLAPGDVSFKVAGLPVKLNWDVAYNRDGTDRSHLYADTTTYTYNTIKATATSTAVPAAGGTPTITATTATSTQTSTSSKGIGDVLNGEIVTGLKSAATTANTTFKTSSADNWAYLLGFQVGENKKKGDWSMLANYRQVGLSAVDPNINDSDWALSNTNMAGYKAAFVYNLGDATTIGLTYYAADNLRKNLGAWANTYGPGSTKSSVNVIQLDAVVKF